MDVFLRFQFNLVHDDEEHEEDAVLKEIARRCLAEDQAVEDDGWLEIIELTHDQDRIVGRLMQKGIPDFIKVTLDPQEQ